MKNAWIRGLEIIPFDSVEFVTDISHNYNEHQNILIHFHSKKDTTLIGEKAVSFVQSYAKYIQDLTKMINELEV